jgi:predicted DNA binding CopG/RHH family protein
MKRDKLDKEEKEILRAYESDRLKRVKNFEEEKAKLEQYARSTLQKRKNINIRISTYDLLRLKEKAFEEGLPYQTYVASVLHKSVSGRR